MYLTSEHSGTLTRWECSLLYHYIPHIYRAVWTGIYIISFILVTSRNRICKSFPGLYAAQQIFCGVTIQETSI